MRLTEKIPELIDPQALYSSNGQEAWRVLGIMSEFTVATEWLRGIRPAVSIFGSARIREGHAFYEKTRDIAKRLSDAGFAVISGGGPGLMEAANKGAFAGRSPAIGLNILLPKEQQGNAFQDVSVNFRYFFARKMMFVRFASAYVVLPGGFGTVDELSECLTELVARGRSDGDAAIGLEKVLREEVHLPRELLDVEGDAVGQVGRTFELGAAALQRCDQGHRLPIPGRVLGR